MKLVQAAICRAWYLQDCPPEEMFRPPVLWRFLQWATERKA